MTAVDLLGCPHMLRRGVRSEHRWRWRTWAQHSLPKSVLDARELWPDLPAEARGVVGRKN